MPLMVDLLISVLNKGVGLLVEAGFARQVQWLKDRLGPDQEQALRQSFDRAYTKAVKEVREEGEEVQSLWEHRPFQEEVVTSLLDPEHPFDPRTVADSWENDLPIQARSLRRFFSALENTLLEDKTWGPLLERFQTLRFRQDVLKALRERNLDVPVSQITSSIHIKRMKGSSKAVAVEIGEVKDGGQVNIHHTTLVDSKDETEAFRRRYLQKVSVETNRLPWAPIDREQADAEGRDSLGLTTVYTALDTTELERVECEEDLRELQGQLERGEARRIPAQEMANQEGKLLILGDPGSGKSTFIKQLAYHLAQACQEEDPASHLEPLSPWDHGSLLPVLVELRDWAAGLSPKDKGSAKLLLDYLEQTLAEWKLEGFWPALCGAIQGSEEEQRLLVLLDGLDEVPSELRGLVVETVQDFADRYGRHRYAVTCRPYAYVGQPWKLVGFHEVTLAPFDKEQIDSFIAGWYEQQHQRERLSKKDADEKTGQMQRAVRQKGLLPLAQRPLLLTIMATLHTHRGRLPDDRTELYADAVDLLLRRWEEKARGEVGVIESLDIPNLRMSNLEAGLHEVAFRVHSAAGEGEGPVDILEESLRKWLAPHLGGDWNKAGRFVEYIRERAGLLVRHKTDAYTFPHRTFQEFLAACHLVGQANYAHEAARLAREDTSRWHEVFTLAAGHAARTHQLGRAIDSVNNLCPRDAGRVKKPDRQDFQQAVLAGEALREIGLVGVQQSETGRAVLERVQGWLVAAMKADEVLQARERADAGAELGRLGDPRFRADAFYLPDENLWGFVEVPAGKFTMGSSDADSMARGNEKPQHRVDLPTFYMARYPVTVAQFGAFVESSGHKAYERSLQVLPNHPVVLVTWHEAVAYCQWLTKVLREREDTPEPLGTLLREKGWVVTLPSEAEWEKAARGTDGRIYPWGGEPDPERANYDVTGIGTTSAVGCFPGGASPYGLEELSGNVLEWTRSLYKPYPYNPVDGREDLEAEGIRALRGGSWFLNRGWARCAYRVVDFPLGRCDFLGFRVVFSPAL